MEENHELNEFGETADQPEITGLMPDEKIKKKKSKRKKIAASIFVLLLAVGIGGNWVWENSDVSSKIKSVASSTKTLGEATFVDAATQPSSGENEYFSSARVDRQNARDSALSQLQSVVDSSEESSDAKNTAAEKIADISSYIEIENKIETLVQAKGVSNCLAVVNEDGTRVDVIIDSEELSDDLALQIKEIAVAQLKCGFENVTIIQSKN